MRCIITACFLHTKLLFLFKTSEDDLRHCNIKTTSDVGIQNMANSIPTKHNRQKHLLKPPLFPWWQLHWLMGCLTVSSSCYFLMRQSPGVTLTPQYTSLLHFRLCTQSPQTLLNGTCLHNQSIRHQSVGLGINLERKSRPTQHALPPTRTHTHQILTRNRPSGTALRERDSGIDVLQSSRVIIAW